MYQVNHIDDKLLSNNYLEIDNSELGIYAKIDLNCGGSLQELTLSNYKLISSENLSYDKHFNSAILFPYVNRIQNGVYNFQNKAYQLFRNKSEEGHAIHGLVYNKTFTISSVKEEEGKLLVNLTYKETQPEIGFPYKYTLYITYTIQPNSLSLNVNVKNDDENTFPFAIGWHPYFVCDNLYNSTLVLNRNSKINFDAEFNYHIEDVKNTLIKIENNEFDDCYRLMSNETRFETTTYHIKIEFKSAPNYLQVYTPENRNYIALEPQTGVTNNFNNKLGLKLLKPAESFNEEWRINLLNTN